MAEALEAMRRSLGPEAVLVASREDARGVRVTAAVEHRDDLDRLIDVEDPEQGATRLEQVLTWHGLPPTVARRLVQAAATAATGDPVTALASLFANGCAARPVEAALEGTRVFVGPPGAGKTLVIAKLAAAARLAGRPVRVFCSEDARAGEQARLRELLAPVGLRPEPMASTTDVASDGEPGSLRLVDLPGIDPGRGPELARLAELLAAVGGRPLLVWPAGTDPGDACDAAANFAALGIRECIVTRLDLARRLGSVLAAVAHGLALLGLSLGPSLARPIVPVVPARLAALLVERATTPEGTPP